MGLSRLIKKYRLFPPHIIYLILMSSTLIFFQNCKNEQGFNVKKIQSTPSTEREEGELIPLPVVTVPPEAQPPATAICDPFAKVPSKAGIKGVVYYMDPNNRFNYTGVMDFLSKGILLQNDIYLSQINVPTLEYTSGFQSSDGALLKNSNNEPIFEYFALALDTNVQLGPNDEEGYYQFAVISDDGSMIWDIDEQNQMQTLINNDGDHSTRMKCADRALYFKKNELIPLRLAYYQGPRTKIAFTLVWKKVNSESMLPSDANCDQKFAIDYNFSGEPINSAQLKAKALMNEGWNVLKTDNYYLEENVVCEK